MGPKKDNYFGEHQKMLKRMDFGAALRFGPHTFIICVSGHYWCMKSCSRCNPILWGGKKKMPIFTTVKCIFTGETKKRKWMQSLFLVGEMSMGPSYRISHQNGKCLWMFILPTQWSIGSEKSLVYRMMKTHCFHTVVKIHFVMVARSLMVWKYSEISAFWWVKSLA